MVIGIYQNSTGPFPKETQVGCQLPIALWAPGFGRDCLTTQNEMWAEDQVDHECPGTF